MDVFCGNSNDQVSELEKLAKNASKLPKEQQKVLKAVLNSFLENSKH